MKGIARKYNAGEIWYMKRTFKSLGRNEMVKIINVYKKGRKTFVDVQDVNRQTITRIPAKMLRKHSR